ncbi:MAG: hypothetical protein ACRCW2_09095 [Cellulosilyticaceae bacterium]
MNKKISELLEELDYEWLEQIEIEEEFPQGVCLERIKDKALESIVEEEVIPLRAMERKIKSKKRMSKRIFLPLVAALALMGMTAVAVNSNDRLRAIVGDALPLIQSEVQAIEEANTDKGITFTAEAAAIENKAGIFYLTAQHVDGSPFEEGTEFRRISPRMEKKGGMGWSTHMSLSEAGDKLVVRVDLSGSRKLYDQVMRFEAYDIGTWKEGEVSPDIDLYEAYQSSRDGWQVEEEKSWQDYDYNASLKIYPIASYKGYTLDRVVFESGKLYLITSATSPNGESLLEDERLTLVDVRTNEVVTEDGGSGNWDQEIQREKMCHRFLGVDEADLPYLRLKIDYRYFQPEIEGTWSVAFELDKNENVMAQKLWQRIQTDDIHVTLYDLEVSKLGVKIEGLRRKGYLGQLTGYVQMKDGSKVELIQSGSWSKFWLLFGVQYKFGDVIEGDAKQLSAEGTMRKAVEEREDEPGWGMAMSSISVSTQKTSGEEDLPQVIALDQIESIVFEDHVIPMK